MSISIDVSTGPGVQGIDMPTATPSIALQVGASNIPVASETVLGGVMVGDNLKIENGVLSVDTAVAVQQDNTKPVTSGAVHMELGNIEALLAAL